MDFCFVNNGMDLHHHNDDVAARTISPGMAFLFTRLRIGVKIIGARGFLQLTEIKCLFAALENLVPPRGHQPLA